MLAFVYDIDFDCPLISSTLLQMSKIEARLRTDSCEPVSMRASFDASQFWCMPVLVRTRSSAAAK